MWKADILIEPSESTVCFFLLLKNYSQSLVCSCSLHLQPAHRTAAFDKKLELLVFEGLFKGLLHGQLTPR